MAEKLCSLRKKGGKMSETVLWTNPSPSVSFSGQNITLSKSIADYKQLKMTVLLNTASGWGEILTFLFDTEELMKSATANSGHVGAISGRHLTQPLIYYYVRFILCSSATTLFIGEGTLCDVTNYVMGTRNDALIPQEVIGLK